MASTLQESCAAVASGWRDFWFRPADPRPLAAVRIATGLVLAYWFVAYSVDLIAFFGPAGLAPLAFTAEHWGAGKVSLLFVTDAPAWLWTVHVAAVVAAAALTIGVGGRLAALASWAFLLSYANRAPQLTGLFEPTAAFVLLYLWIGPCGQALAIGRKESPLPSIGANIAARLLQIHLAAWFGLSAMAKYSDSAWWDGSAMWRLAVREAGPLVDLTALHASPFLWNAWTHVVPAFELAFAILIWHVSLRPLLLVAMPFVLIGPALLTGELAYYWLICGAALVFAPPRLFAGRRAEA